MEQTTNKESKKETPGKTGKNTGMAIVAYILFFIPLLTEAKDDPFVKYHVKQGIVLLIIWVACGFFSRVPVIGWSLAPFLNLALFVLMIIGILSAAKGEEKPLPLIGKFAESFKI